jgi:hypothetical protein
MNPILQTKLGVHDVLLGRGTGPNAHEGNKHFRAMTAEALERSITLAVSHSSKLDLARKLVARVYTRKGRFVRKLTKEEVAAVSPKILKTSDKKLLKKHNYLLRDMYMVVPEDVAIDKAKQSFFHQLRRRLSSEAGTAGSGTVALKHCPPSFSSTTIVEQESTTGQAPLMKWSPPPHLQTLHRRHGAATRLEDLKQDTEEENVVRANPRIHHLGRASTNINGYAGVCLPPKKRTQVSPQQTHHALLDPGAFMMMGRSSYEHHLIPVLQKSPPPRNTTTSTSTSELLRRVCRHPAICDKNEVHNNNAPSFQHHAPSSTFDPDLFLRSRDRGHGRRSLLLLDPSMFRAGLPCVPPPPPTTTTLLRGLFATSPAFSLCWTPPPGAGGASVLAYRSFPAFRPSLPAVSPPAPGGGCVWSSPGRTLPSSSSLIYTSSMDTTTSSSLDALFLLKLKRRTASQQEV